MSLVWKLQLEKDLQYIVYLKIPYYCHT